MEGRVWAYSGDLFKDVDDLTSDIIDSIGKGKPGELSLFQTHHIRLNVDLYVPENVYPELHKGFLSTLACGDRASLLLHLYLKEHAQADPDPTDPDLISGYFKSLKRQTIRAFRVFVEGRSR